MRWLLRADPLATSALLLCDQGNPSRDRVKASRHLAPADRAIVSVSANLSHLLRLPTRDNPVRLPKRILRVSLILDRIDRHFKLACRQCILLVLCSVGAVKLQRMRNALRTTDKQVRHPIHATSLLFDVRVAH